MTVSLSRDNKNRHFGMQAFFGERVIRLNEKYRQL